MKQFYTYDENDMLVQKNMDSNNFSVKIKKCNNYYCTNWENIATKLNYKRAKDLFLQQINQYKYQRKTYNRNKISYFIRMCLDNNPVNEVEI